MTKATKALPTLAECEKALGEKANTWVARCYEISRRIVKTGLVKGEAVYGHWLGPVHPRSHFANRRDKLPFIQHGWILLDDAHVLDPTRWVFEAKKPYLYTGTVPDDWDVTPCKNCGLLEEEHDEGHKDDCGLYEVEQWPYDEGGNRWRSRMGPPAPVPKPHDQRLTFRVSPRMATFVAALLGQIDGTRLTSEQIFWLANLPYQTITKAGNEAVKEIYEAICSVHRSFIGFIPIDNANRARREWGFNPKVVLRIE
jgi:hypothetical protein